MDRPITLNDIPRLPANLPEKLEIYIMETILGLEAAEAAGEASYKAFIIQYFGGWQNLRPTVRKPTMRDSTWIRNRNADHREAFEELRIRYDLWRAQTGRVRRIELPDGLIVDQAGPMVPSSTMLPQQSQLLFKAPIVYEPQHPVSTLTRSASVLSSRPQPPGGMANPMSAQFTPQQYDGSTGSFSSSAVPNPTLASSSVPPAAVEGGLNMTLAPLGQQSITNSWPIANTAGGLNTTANAPAFDMTDNTMASFTGPSDLSDVGNLAFSTLVCPVERHRELWKAVVALLTVLELEHGVVPCGNCTCNWTGMGFGMGQGAGMGL